jgi:kynurenine formamidase
VPTDLPPYAELPVTEGAPKGSSWGVWGDGDVFGTLNLLTPEGVRGATASIRTGRVFALNLELELPDPPAFGRDAMVHEVTGADGNSSDDIIRVWNTQASSQWDGFRHVRSPAHGAYSGIPEGEHGIHHWARRGLAGRAVLADVARWREAEGRPIEAGEREEITVDDLEATLAHQGSIVETGDVFLFRTGWTTWYRGLDAAARAAWVADGNPAAGLLAHEDTAAWLWDHHVAAVGSDGPALEAWPIRLMMGERTSRAALADPAHAAAMFLHFSLLPLLGMPIGELFDLDALAADCATTGTWDSFFTSAPINLQNGVASPPNALCIR